MLRLFNLGASDARQGHGSLTPSVAEAALLDALSDGVITCDPADRVTYANPAAADLFTREATALIGEQLLNLFTRESRDAVRFGQSAARDGLPQSAPSPLAQSRRRSRSSRPRDDRSRRPPSWC